MLFSNKKGKTLIERINRKVDRDLIDVSDNLTDFSAVSVTTRTGGRVANGQNTKRLVTVGNVQEFTDLLSRESTDPAGSYSVRLFK